MSEILRVITENLAQQLTNVWIAELPKLFERSVLYRNFSADFPSTFFTDTPQTKNH